MIEDLDYIPFEGPLHRFRGPRKLSPAEVEQGRPSRRCAPDGWPAPPRTGAKSA
jgi:hypothetical protein